MRRVGEARDIEQHRELRGADTEAQLSKFWQRR